MNDEECVLDDISSIITTILLVAVVLLNPYWNFSCNKRNCLCVLRLLGDWYAAQQVLRYYLNYTSILVSLCPTGGVLRRAFKSLQRHAVSVTLPLHKRTYVLGYCNSCVWKRDFTIFYSGAIDFALKCLVCQRILVRLVSSESPQAALTSNSRSTLNQWTVQHSINMHSVTPLEFPRKSSRKGNGG